MKILKDEIWKPFVLNENYLISNYGRWFSLRSMKLLKEDVNNCGYLRLNTHFKGKQFRVFTHYAVVITFGDCKGKKFTEKDHTILDIDHVNGDKRNNSLSNLEIVTHQENCYRRDHLSELLDEIVKCNKQTEKETLNIF